MRPVHRWQYQYLGTATLPKLVSQLELDAFFTFSATELNKIRSRHKTNHRIAAAVQLGFVKMAGHPLDALRVLPVALLKHVGDQLDLSSPTIASLRAIYRRRPRTLFEHQAWALETAHFVRASDKQLAWLLNHLRTESRHAISVDHLVEAGKVWLYQHRFIFIGDRPLRDYARQAFAESEQGLLAIIQGIIPASTRQEWERGVLQLRERSKITNLEWLGEPPRKGNRTALRNRVDRIDYLKSLGVDQFDLDVIPMERIRFYGAQLQRLRAAKFRELKEPTRILRLVCFLKFTLMTAIDTAVLMAGKQIARLWGDAYEKAKLLQVEHNRSRSDILNEVFAMVDDDNLSDAKFRTKVRKLKQAKTAPQFPNRAAAARWLLSEPGSAIRPILAEVQKLGLQWETRFPADQSMALLQELYASKANALPDDPRIQCPKGWQFIVQGDDRERALRALEGATLMELRKGLRSGAVFIDQSERFRSRDRLLISQDRWEKERNRRCTQLSLPLKAESYLDRLCESLEYKLALVERAVSSGEIWIQEGTIRLPRLKAELPPEDAERMRTAVFREIGTVQFPNLILEMDSHTGFSAALLGRPARSDQELLKIYGAMLAHGTSNDASAVALMMPQVETSHILSAMYLFEDPVRVRAANDAVSSYQRQFPISGLWGDGSLASSDSTSLDVYRDLWNARLDPRRRTPSIGTYTHLADFWSIVYDRPIVLGERQAGVAIEGAIRQKEIHIDQLAVDTHGWTHFAMGLAKLLGLDLCPRLKRLNDRKLFVPKRVTLPAGLEGLATGRISLKAIKKYWDELIRIVASVETGEITAMTALAWFGSAAATDPVYRAGVALGELVQSLYLCDYFTSEAFRRVIHRMLVHGEAVHQLQRAIYLGSFSKPRGQRDEELIAMSGSLTLMTNLCLAWTTSKIQSVLQTSSFGNDTTWLKAVSPAHFRHINLKGTFAFPVDHYRERLFGEEAIVAQA